MTWSGLRERGIRVAEFVGELFDVVRVSAFLCARRTDELIENRRHVRRDRVVDVGRRRQHFVLDLDGPCSLFSGVAVYRGDTCYGVSGVERLVAGEDVVHRPLEVGDSFAEVHHLVVSIWQVGVGDD